MKKIGLFIAFGVLVGIGSTSCKKCQTCTTKTTQNVMGYDQTVTTSDEYCGDEYDNAPEPGTYSQTVGSIDQQVVITCEDS